MHAGMNALPQELITHIASFIERKDPGLDHFERQKAVSQLPSYATISRPWQQAIESRTFHAIHFNSTELPYFVQILHRHRRQFLSSLTYDVVLPTYIDKQCARFETIEDMQRNNRAVTYAIHALFQFLKTWQGDATSQGHQGSHYLSLDLFDIYSPMDPLHRPSAKFDDDKESHGFGRRHDLFENRYKRSLLHLLEHPQLPTLSCAVLLATKLPNAESVTLHLKDDEKTDARARQQLRHDLAIALPTISTPSLREFTLCFSHKDPNNHYYTLPSALLPSAPAIDHSSLALHTLSLSPGLTSITLDPIIISPDLYWPANPSTPPTWPTLCQFHVGFNMTAPDGTWYFVRDPSKPDDENVEGDDSDDLDEEAEIDSDPDFDFGSDSFFSTTSSASCPDTFNERHEARTAGDYPHRSFRTLPLDTHINPLLLAMARAAACMPRLQHMSLTSTAHDATFEILFYAAGQASHLGSESWDRPRLYLYVGTWRPDDEIFEVWQENRKGLLVRFNEW
ncbi:MAG: hypothetical protein Q9184_004462 [Pyrenodesmia sp. 2 TL-2023]